MKAENIALMDIIYWCKHHRGAQIYYMQEFNHFFKDETPETIALEILSATPGFTLRDEYFWYNRGCLTSGSAAEAIAACIDDLEAVVQEMIAAEDANE